MRALAETLCSVITTRRAYEDLEGEASSAPGRVWERSSRRFPTRRWPPIAAKQWTAPWGEAVRAGRRAGLTDELRDILEETLQREVANVHQGGTP